MKNFSSSWKGSKKQRKQRKYRYWAPFHIKQKLAHSHLSKELMKKYEKRGIGLRKGDKVKIMRGIFKKREGTVQSINLRKIKVFVTGIEVTKRDGTKRPFALHPSNLVITELNLDDKFRSKIFGRK